MAKFIHFYEFKMKLKDHFLYQNESILNIYMSNLTKIELTSMEQILSFLAQCMLKLFQITGDKNLNLSKEG